MILLFLAAAAAVAIAVFFDITVGCMAFGVFLIFLMIKRNYDLKSVIHNVPKGASHAVNLDIGGVFEVYGYGDYKENKKFTVEAKNLYREGDFYWFELVCTDDNGEKAYIEVEDDDETKVCATLKRLTMTDIGVSGKGLEECDDAESGIVEYEGSYYSYLESDSAVYYKNSDSKEAERLYYWDFINVNRDRLIGVEKWGESEFHVYYCQIIPLSQITILKLRS